MIIRSRSLRRLFLRKLPITTPRGHHKITDLNIAYDLFCHRIPFDRVPQSHGDHIQLINRCTAMSYFNISERTTSVSMLPKKVARWFPVCPRSILNSLQSLQFSLPRVPFSSMSSSHSGLDAYNVPSWMCLQAKQFHQSTSHRLHRCFQL